MEEMKRKAKKVALEVANSLKKKVLAIALRGSLITGHFTRRSDVDLFAITESGQWEVQVIFRKGFYVQIQYYPLTVIESLLRMRDRRVIDYIINSEAIVDRNGVYRSLHDKVSKTLSSKAHLEADLKEGLHRINDAQAHFETGNYEAAVAELRLAAVNFAEIVLLTEGYTCLMEHKQPLCTKKLQPKYPDFIQNYNRILGANKVKKAEVEELMFRIVEMLTSVQTLLKNHHNS